nr:hypothetical protein [Tanacetum cinerariifolium]
DSRIEDRKEAKRRCKEERKLKKEEKHRRREERQSRREEALSDPKKLEIELRENALESLKAKKGVGPARKTPRKERSPIPRKRQRETMNSKDPVDHVELEEKDFSRPRKERRRNKNSVNGKYDNSKYSPEKLTSHLPTGT